eukprot:GFKZ01002779.1.p2 GENE.GFKZ01002779.1~~GFKZ01002779.1.p2  ORF type:complete len:150 (+),score=4.15 GFKZ01002779.1:160-609(+)
MPKHHPGVHVIHDTALPRYTRCYTRMDHLGNHATDLYPNSIGWKNRYQVIVDMLDAGLLQAAGVGVDYEVKQLLSGFHARPADIVVHPRSIDAELSHLFPVVHDLAVSSPRPSRIAYIKWQTEDHKLSRLIRRRAKEAGTRYQVGRDFK